MLGRAVAIGQVRGATAGLGETDRLRDVFGGHRVSAHLHELGGDLTAAAADYANAARRATSVRAERDHLIRQAARVRATAVNPPAGFSAR